MAKTLDAIARMVAQLSKLPGIGQKTAQRLAYFIVGLPEAQVRELAAAIYNGKRRLHLCPTCGYYTEGELCEFCRDEARGNGMLCVVKGARDVLAIERVREYEGHYHVLGGVISPMSMVGPGDIRIAELIERLKTGAYQEVILATNADVEGEATASYIAKLVKPMGIHVTRLAHGIPIGGDLEYADEATLESAFRGRSEA